MSNYAVTLLAYLSATFVGMLAAGEAGRRLGSRHAETGERAAPPEAGRAAIEASMFALLGLLIAFTFSGAASRFDDRRMLIIEEANAIGTAFLRLDLFPPASRSTLQDEFRRYVDLRLAFYRELVDADAARTLMAESLALQHRIWDQAVAATREAPPSAAIVVLPALNTMIDIVTTRTAAFGIHPPLIIFAMLALLALICAFLGGLGMGKHQLKSRLHAWGFATIITLTIYATLEIEYPRRGLVRVDAFDQLLVDVRRSMD
jgi:hypothetical protein